MVRKVKKGVIIDGAGSFGSGRNSQFFKKRDAFYKAKNSGSSQKEGERWFKNVKMARSAPLIRSKGRKA